MTAIIDLSFPGQRTAIATSCITHNSVYMPGPRAGKSENGFFRCDTWLQIFQNDSRICEAEVTLTPIKFANPGRGLCDKPREHLHGKLIFLVYRIFNTWFIYPKMYVDVQLGKGESWTPLSGGY